MGERDRIRVQHMLDAANKVISATQNRQRADLDRDEILALAIVRLLEILGEAAKNVSQATRQSTPHIPWRQMAGTRDRLTHAYFDVNLDIIWTIATEDLPAIVPQLEALLKTLTP